MRCQAGLCRPLASEHFQHLHHIESDPKLCSLQAEKESADRLKASQLTPWQERPGICANILSRDPGLYRKLNDMRAGRF